MGTGKPPDQRENLSANHSPGRPTDTPQVFGVDPDVVTRGLLALYLEPLGFSVRLVGALSDAITQLQTGVPRGFLCAEAALEEAGAEQRTQVRALLGELPVVVLLEPGEAPVWTRDWPNVLERLTKPVQGDALARLVNSWATGESHSPADPEAGKRADGLDPLAGLDALVREIGMEPDLVQDLVRSFQDRAPQYLADLRTALAAQEIEQARRTLHAITGMCANLRLDPLVTLTAAVRGAVVAGDLDAAGIASKRLEERCTQVAAAAGARWKLEA